MVPPKRRLLFRRAVVAGFVILNAATAARRGRAEAFPAAAGFLFPPSLPPSGRQRRMAGAVRPPRASSTSSSFSAAARVTMLLQRPSPETAATTTTTALAASPSPSSREDEIRRKIRQLKREGKIGGGNGRGGGRGSPEAASADAPFDGDDDDDDVYEEEDADGGYLEKVRSKLGRSKSRLLGFGDGAGDGDAGGGGDPSPSGAEDDAAATTRKVGRIGSIPELQQKNQEQQQQPQQSVYLQDGGTSSSSSQPQGQLRRGGVQIDPTMFDRADVRSETDPPEMTEEELVELVAQRLADKRAREDAAIEAAALERKAAAASRAAGVTKDPSTSQDGPEQQQTQQQQTTTGVGGAWIKGNETAAATNAAEADLYKPKTGSWGAFPRPKDISKAYGGGRRVGPGFSNEDDDAEAAMAASLRTQRLLKDYREKVGIDVPTEREHAAEIDEALQIGQVAMQRGVYGTAVSALERVTQWCSTNSKVGSKVYLELAMAYEAVGRTKEASQVYRTLTECRMEDVRYNAKRLLYGMEAIELMRDVSADFSRKKTRNTFIDATGLDNIASNFDDVYNTAYIDLEGGFYKKLTESVVRSHREARQILLQATGKGEVSRTRVVQALRCLARNFDERLESEIATVQEPTAYLNGKPIVVGGPTSSVPSGRPDASGAASMGDFTLPTAEEMVQSLNGRWQLQLLADRQGDGVSYYNTTAAMQEFVVSDMTFRAKGRSGLANVESSGRISLDGTKRILARSGVATSTGGGLFSVFRGRDDSGFSAAVSRDQQIVSVDSILLVTKCPKGSRKDRDQNREHFAVWRRISPPGEEAMP